MNEKRNQLPARHELKYFISPAELTVLRSRIEPVMTLDRHCVKGRPYIIRSLYFDDIDDSAFYEKIGGTQFRDKYRIRIYRYSDKEIFLERKRKLGDLIQKSSVRISRRLCEQLIDGDPRGLQNASDPLLQDMFVQMRLRLLRPKVIVDYKRLAFKHIAENVRITFDIDLHSGLYSKELFDAELPTVRPLDTDVEILEVKFDNYLPDYIARLMDGIVCERSAVSKYVYCRRFEPLSR